MLACHPYLFLFAGLQSSGTLFQLSTNLLQIVTHHTIRCLSIMYMNSSRYHTYQLCCVLFGICGFWCFSPLITLNITKNLAPYIFQSFDGTDENRMCPVLPNLEKIYNVIYILLDMGNAQLITFVFCKCFFFKKKRRSWSA